MQWSHTLGELEKSSGGRLTHSLGLRVIKSVSAQCVTDLLTGETLLQDQIKGLFFFRNC